MPKAGPIVMVEDDIDDQEIIAEVFAKMKTPNKLIIFANAKDALQYLKTTADKLFIILCDINLPGMNGLTFKREIDNDMQLREKSIPFIFFSTAAPPEVVTEAYTEMTVQGFFKKVTSIAEIERTLTTIVEYWKLSRHPNSQ